MELRLSRLSFLFVCGFAVRALLVGGFTSAELTASILFSVLFLGSQFMELGDDRKKLEKLVAEHSANVDRKFLEMEEKFAKLEKSLMDTKDSISAVRLSAGLKKLGS